MHFASKKLVQTNNNSKPERVTKHGKETRLQRRKPVRHKIGEKLVGSERT